MGRQAAIARTALPSAALFLWLSAWEAPSWLSYGVARQRPPTLRDSTCRGATSWNRRVGHFKSRAGRAPRAKAGQTEVRERRRRRRRWREGSKRRGESQKGERSDWIKELSDREGTESLFHKDRAEATCGGARVV